MEEEDEEFDERENAVVHPRPGYAFAGDPNVNINGPIKKLLKSKGKILFVLVFLGCLIPVIYFLIVTSEIAKGNAKKIVKDDIGANEPQTFRQLARESTHIRNVLQQMETEMAEFKAWNHTMYRKYHSHSREINKQRMEMSNINTTVDMHQKELLQLKSFSSSSIGKLEEDIVKLLAHNNELSRRLQGHTDQIAKHWKEIGLLLKRINDFHNSKLKLSSSANIPYPTFCFLLTIGWILLSCR